MRERTVVARGGSLLVSAWFAAAGCGAAPTTRAMPSIRVVPPEVDGRIVINELMAANVLTLSDERGVAAPWVELLNPGETDLSLEGYGLTDDLDVPGKAVLPPDVALPAGGRVLLWLDGDPSVGPNHLGLRLPAAGGALGLSRPDGSFIDRVRYDGQAVDFSAAREPDGAARWVIEWHVSPGAANPAPAADAQSGAPAADPDAVEEIVAAGDLTERILGYDVMPKLGLTLTPEAIASLRAAPRTDVPAQLELDGRSYGPVAVHLKGMNSFEPIDAKPAFRIDVDAYADGAAFFGLGDLTLDNMHSDASMMHERLAYRVAREAGIPASRSNHALVTVNGELFGLYANVETVKHRAVARWFADGSGPLFSAPDVDFEARFLPGYVLESGPDDRSLLSGLAAALALPGNDDDTMAAAAAYVDLDQLARFWAMCAVAGQLDSFPYSLPGDDYFLYADPTTHLLSFIPWGMDETFFAPDFDVTKVNSVLARRCAGSSTCFARFVTATWDLLSKVEAMGWAAEVNRVAAQIAPHTTADRRKPYTDDAVRVGQDGVRFFIATRRAQLSSWLPTF